MTSNVVVIWPTPRSRNFLATFFYHDAATTAIYTLSLHDALPISRTPRRLTSMSTTIDTVQSSTVWGDRKSTRLNSSHVEISYAVFCLKKKKKNTHNYQ